MVHLALASGERRLAAELLALGIAYTVEPLPVGDVVIRKSLSAGSTPVVILERKTVADLMQSIVDGRYREQATRLADVTAPVWWVIEGKPMHVRRDPQATARMFAAIARLGLLHRFVPVRTDSTRETAVLLQKLIAKVPDLLATVPMQEGDGAGTAEAGGAGGPGGAGGVVEYSHPHKRFKSDCITRDNVQALMLAQVPGVSVPRARAILDAIPLCDILQGKPIPRGLKSSSGPGKDPRTIPKNVLTAVEDYLHPQQSA